MAAPEGIWNINAKGYQGTLNINAPPKGVLSGTIELEVGFTETLQGVWSEPAQEITFQRVLTHGGTTTLQTSTGYLYLTKEPIFSPQGPPEPDSTFRLLTGFFEAMGSGTVPGWPRLGGVARQNI
jgi:hypothetical protein